MEKSLIRHLLDEFRQWQADWDRWDRHKENWFRTVFLTKPPSHDEFLEKCEAKFSADYSKLKPYNPNPMAETKVVSDDELGWMLAQGWTLASDNPDKEKTSEGCHRIEKIEGARGSAVIDRTADGNFVMPTN